MTANWYKAGGRKGRKKIKKKKNNLQNPSYYIEQKGILFTILTIPYM